MAEVKKAFNPEFLNRLDEVILFTSLADEDLLQIINLLVEQINVNLVAKQIKIRVNEDAAKYILEKTLVDRSYGARPLRRALQKFIEDPLSEALIQGTLPRPSELEVYLGDSGIFCLPSPESFRNSLWALLPTNKLWRRPPAFRSIVSNLYNRTDESLRS